MMGLAAVGVLAAAWLVSLRWWLTHQAAMRAQASEEMRGELARLKLELGMLSQQVRELDQRSHRR